MSAGHASDWVEGDPCGASLDPRRTLGSGGARREVGDAPTIEVGISGSRSRFGKRTTPPPVSGAAMPVDRQADPRSNRQVGELERETGFEPATFSLEG